MKIRNSLILLFSVAVTRLAQPAAHAEIGMGDVLGTAWTIGNAIQGTTTLTPAYAIKTWYQRLMQTGMQPPMYYPVTYKINRDLLGSYFYYSKNSAPNAVFPESTMPFPLKSVNKLNRTCPHDMGGVILKDIAVETHTELVWMAKVETTGLWPDDGPWTVWLKTAGTKANCYPSNPTELYFWVSASIGKSGSDTVTLGNPNCTLNYPFYLADEFYK